MNLSPIRRIQPAPIGCLAAVVIPAHPYPGSQGEMEYCAGPEDVRKAVRTLLEAFLAHKGPPDIPAGT